LWWKPVWENPGLKRIDLTYMAESENNPSADDAKPTPKGVARSRSIPWPWLGFTVFLMLFNATYFFLATQLFYQTNRDRMNRDQEHNITMADRTLEREQAEPGPKDGITSSMWRKLPHFTDGVVNPLWPWVAARFQSEDHETYFQRGKWFNIVLVAVFLNLFGIVCTRVFSIPGAINLVLIAGLGALLPRAVFFQPESIYYILFFATWACCLALMRHNELWLYALLGLFAGLAYLAKSSVQPLLLVFLGVTALRFVVEASRRKRGKIPDSRWHPQNHFIGMAVLAMSFLMVVGPRLSFANERYGDPFHSYPSYWLWMDHFEDGYQFMADHGSKESLQNITSENKPSMSNYARSHTRQEAWERMRDGVITKVEGMLYPQKTRQNKAHNREWKQLTPDRGRYLLWLLVIAGVMAGYHWWALRQSDAKDILAQPWSGGWMLLFAAGAFALYAMAYGFYSPIGKGDRFMLSLYLPLAVTLVWVAERLHRQTMRVRHNRWAGWIYMGMHLALTLVVTLRVVDLLKTPLFRG